ncbi:hypothetical protein BJ912DRAFT_250562 [Pholiota molesta]|nr:hypothetical protein BJ912DRAFT_250562 [Pholiota molesta]
MREWNSIYGRSLCEPAIFPFALPPSYLQSAPSDSRQMLTLTPGCACDVCAEEYGTHRPPHSIPCGHVLCASCIQTIVEKTSSRLGPVCPFCRESFTRDGARLIRMDFATSGWTTPRRFPAADTLNTINSDLLQRRTANLFSAPPDGPRARIEVRRLEDKVARIAAKKCSVEEVSMLYKELEDWLLSEKDDQTSSLFLSAALLRAILMNHLAHSEASKAAKTTDANLRHKIEDLELNNTKYEAELKRQRAQYTQKERECAQLRTDVSQLRALATTLGGSNDIPSPTSAHPTYATSPASPPHSTSTSPTPYSSSQSHYPSSSASAAAAAPLLARFNSMHSRSASASARPTTPAQLAHAYSQQPTPSPPRSHTPAPRSHTPGPPASASAAFNAAYTTSPPRSHTPAGHSSASAQARSHTPAPRSHTPSLMRSHTPAPAAVPAVPALPARYATPTPGGGGGGYGLGSGASALYNSHGHGHSNSLSGYGGLRAQTPGPLVPPKPRRLSLSGTAGGSPPRLVVRSTSEEKAEAHQRWLPSKYDV